MKSSFSDVVSVNCLTFCKGSSEKSRGRQKCQNQYFLLTSPGAKTQYWLNNSKSSHGTNCDTIPLKHARGAQRDTESKAGRPKAFCQESQNQYFFNQTWNVWSGLLGENFVLNDSKSSHGTQVQCSKETLNSRLAVPGHFLLISLLGSKWRIQWNILWDSWKLCLALVSHIRNEFKYIRLGFNSECDLLGCWVHSDANPSTRAER